MYMGTAWCFSLLLERPVESACWPLRSSLYDNRKGHFRRICTGARSLTKGCGLDCAGAGPRCGCGSKVRVRVQGAGAGPR